VRLEERKQVQLEGGPDCWLVEALGNPVGFWLIVLGALWLVRRLVLSL
jgi:hypothetical protein